MEGAKKYLNNIELPF